MLREYPAKELLGSLDPADDAVLLRVGKNGRVSRF